MVRIRRLWSEKSIQSEEVVVLRLRDRGRRIRERRPVRPVCLWLGKQNKLINQKVDLFNSITPFKACVLNDFLKVWKA